MFIYALIFFFNVLVPRIFADTTCNVTIGQGQLIGQQTALVTGEGNYCSFKGIKYAQAPIGNLRLKAPLPVEEWQGVKNATEHGPVCPHVELFTGEYIPGNEDCLYLNIYTKDLSPNISFPVIFFIHGGGFKSGSGNVDSFGPDFLVGGNLSVIVVTINYRLGALGFISLGTKDVPGNAGLKDQAMALKWVYNNIKYFGGDPNKITIMGQSAGSASTALHMFSPMSTGLFRGIIAMSGSPYNDWAIPYHPETRALIFAKNLGCDYRNISKVITCLQNVTTEAMANYSFPYVAACEPNTAVLTKQYAFTPVVERYSGEDNFLTVNLLGSNLSVINPANIFFGYTNQEGITALSFITTLFSLYDAYEENFALKKVCETLPLDSCLAMGRIVRENYTGNETLDTNATKSFVEYINDANFKYDIVKFFSRVLNNGTKFMYEFSSESSRNEYGSQGPPYGVFGAGHIDDLSNCFDPKSRNLTLDLNSTDYKIIVNFTTVIKNFVYTGNPTSDSSLNVTVPEFNNITMNYLKIGTPNLSVSSLKNETYYDFWTSLIEKFGLKY